MDQINLRWKAVVTLGVILLVMSLAAAAPARIAEKELLRNTNELGDFSRVREVKGKDRASLQIWENYREFLAKRSSRLKSLMLLGPITLEVAYDEVWEKETDYDPTLLAPRERRGEPFRVKIYWLKDRFQAYTVWRYFKTDPLTADNLEKPGYRLIVLLDRNTLQPEFAKLEAKEQAFATMAAGLHLQEAHKAMALGNPQEKDIKKRTYGRLEEARRHLEAIDRKADEYPAAKKLLKEVERREKDLKKYKEVMRQAVSEAGVRKREELAKELDRDFLGKGFDVKIELSGPEKTAISMECIVFSRPMVFVFVDKSDLLDNLRNAGFEEVVFSNKKIKYAWHIDLNN